MFIKYRSNTFITNMQ